MSWPTSTISTEQLDAATDSPKKAREALLAATQALNQIMNARGVAGGIALLDAEAKIDASSLRGSDLLQVLRDVDGADSGLDADTIDGLEASELIQADGAVSMTIPSSTPNGWTVGREVTGTNTASTVLSLLLESTGIPAAGFGPRLRWEAEVDPPGNPTVIGETSVLLTDPAAGSYDAKLSWRLAHGGSMQDELELDDRKLRLFNVTPAVNPPAGSIFVYAKSNGLYYRDSGGTEVGPLVDSGGGGASSHDGLTGLGDDDHPQYLLANGNREMTGEIQTGAYSILMTELPADPATPGAGKWRLYPKAGGIYYMDDAGAVTGPLGTGGGGGGDHGGLTGLGDDDHPQYLLRQPAANVVINESGGDFDFRIEGDTAPHLFFLDAGNDNIKINDSGAHATAKLYVNGGSVVGVDGVSSGSSPAVRGVASGSGSGVYATGGTASALTAARNTSSVSAPVAQFLDNDGSGAATVLELRHLGIGEALKCYLAASQFEVFSVNATEALVNAAATSYDFRVAGANKTHLLFVDTSEDRIGINKASGLAGRLHVSGADTHGIFASTDSGGHAGIFAGSAAGYGVLAQTNSGKAVLAQSGTGQAGYFWKTGLGSEATVSILTSTIGDAAPVLQVAGKGAGKLIQVLDGLGQSDEVWAIQDGGYMQMRERKAGPAGNPPTGYWYVYLLSDGLYVKDDQGVATGPFGAGGAGTPALSSLSAATAGNTIDNGDSSQVWRWQFGATSTSGLKLVESTDGSAGTAEVLRVENNSGGSSLSSPLYVKSNTSTVAALVADGGVSATRFHISASASRNSGDHVAHFLHDLDGETDFVLDNTNVGSSAATTLNWNNGVTTRAKISDTHGALSPEFYIWCDNTHRIHIDSQGGGLKITTRNPPSAAVSWLWPTADGTANQVLSTDAAGNLFWQSVSAGTSPALSSVTAASASNTISNAAYAQTWNWSLGGGDVTAMTLGEAAAATSGGTLLRLKNLATSTARLLRLDANSDAASVFDVVCGGTTRLEMDYEGRIDHAALWADAVSENGALFLGEHAPTAPSSQATVGIRGIGRVSGSQTITGSATGVYGIGQYTGTDTCALVIGFQGEAQVANASGTVTRAVGVNATTTETLGTIDEGIGLLVGGIDGTNVWGLLQETAEDNSLLGTLVLGSNARPLGGVASTPTVALDVHGWMNLEAEWGTGPSHGIGQRTIVKTALSGNAASGDQWIGHEIWAWNTGSHDIASGTRQFSAGRFRAIHGGSGDIAEVIGLEASAEHDNTSATITNELVGVRAGWSTKTGTAGTPIAEAASLYLYGGDASKVTNPYGIRQVGQDLVNSFEGAIRIQGANGSYFQRDSVSTTLNTTSGSTATATGVLPADSRILAVLVRILSDITGPTEVYVGLSANRNEYGSLTTLTATTTSALEDEVILITHKTGSTAEDIVLSAIGGNFTAGQVRIVVFFETAIAPTS